MTKVTIELATTHRGRSKDKCQNKNKNRYRDDGYDQIRGRSEEKDYLYDGDDIFHSKMERVHKILQTISQEKEIAIGFMLMFSDNPDKILDNIQSPADVDQLIAERIEYVKIQKAEGLAKDPHVNISDISSPNYVNPVDYESINEGIILTQESVDTEFIEESNSDSDSEEEIQFLDLGECKIVDEIYFRELEQILHATVKE